ISRRGAEAQRGSGVRLGESRHAFLQDGSTIVPFPPLRLCASARNQPRRGKAERPRDQPSEGNQPSEGKGAEAGRELAPQRRWRHVTRAPVITNLLRPWILARLLSGAAVAILVAFA